MGNSDDTNTLFPAGEQASPDYFIGNVTVKNLVAGDDQLNTVISNVVFEAGARNNWHRHPGGQILIATAGQGQYQEKGEAIRLLHKGDVVCILPGVLHWHGASRDSAFTHIAINPNTQKGLVEWLDRVTDEEYLGVYP